jgi:hypothetical protein
MKLILSSLLLLPLIAFAHPGIGIVKDSKGNIYYTDLEKVWKITEGIKSVVIPNMHTHELWIDKQDNLYGEHLMYMNEGTNRFDHFLWMLTPDGTLDTIVKRTRAFVRNDYSLNRDAAGNEFYVKQFEGKDSDHIYWKRPGEKEEIFATANVEGVYWLYPLHDGSVLYVSGNNVYKASKGDTARILAKNIGHPHPTFSFMKSPVVYGMWDDKDGNIYVAVYSDQAIKKISRDGIVTEMYRSSGPWGPNSGVFDNEGKLWVLETSDKNAVRVIKAGTAGTTVPLEKENNKMMLWLFISTVFTILVVFILLFVARRRSRRLSAN